MGAAASKVLKKKNGKVKSNQANQDATSGDGGILATLQAAAESLPVDTKEIVSEVGKNLTEKSEAIAEQVASNIANQLDLSKEKKDTAQKGLQSGLKFVGEQLQDKSKAESNDRPGANKADAVSNESSHQLLDSCSRLGKSALSSNLAERSAAISENIASNAAKQLNLTQDQTCKLKDGLQSGLKSLSSTLEGQNQAEAKEEEISKKQSATTEQNPLSGLIGQAVGSAAIATQVGKTLTQQSESIAKTVVDQVSNVVPQLGLTEDKKETATKALGSVIKGVGEKLSGDDNKTVEQTAPEQKPDKNLPELADFIPTLSEAAQEIPLTGDALTDALQSIVESRELDEKTNDKESIPESSEMKSEPKSESQVGQVEQPKDEIMEEKESAKNLLNESLEPTSTEPLNPQADACSLKTSNHVNSTEKIVDVPQNGLENEKNNSELKEKSLNTNDTPVTTDGDDLAPPEPFNEDSKAKSCSKTADSLVPEASSENDHGSEFPERVAGDEVACHD